jgi:hypothetical protein
MSVIAAAPPTDERLYESAAIVEGSRNDARQTVDVDLIAEGFGNQRDNHFYSKDLLESNVGKFSEGADGVLMFGNHLTRQQEEDLDGQPRPWQQIVGRILPGTARVATREGDGKTVVRGTALISNPLAWAYIEADPKILQVSIDARGHSGPEQMIEGEGRRGKPVLTFHVVKSVDVVSRAGAGGGNMKLNAMAEAWQAFTEAAAADGAAQEAEEATQATDEATDAAAAAGQADGADAQEAAKASCPECKSGKMSGAKCGECGHELAEAADAAATAPDAAAAAAEAPSDAAVEEGVWEPVEGTEREGGREGRDVTPVDAMFGLSQFEDDTLAGDLGDSSEDRDTNPHERLPGGKGSQAARRLAAQMEAEISRRVAVQREEDLAEAEAAFQEALDRIDADHAQTVEQLHQRYAAREQIHGAEALPQATREALIEQFHDFRAEPRREGDTIVMEALDVLRDAVARAIDSKRAEMREASAPVVEAGISGNATKTENEDEGDTRVRESASAPERPARAPLDESLDRELGIE